MSFFKSSSKYYTFGEYLKLTDNNHPDNWEKDHIPLVRLFLPGTNRIWLINYLINDLPTLAHGIYSTDLHTEVGLFDLNELGKMRGADFSTVQRDTKFKTLFPLSVYEEAARIHGSLVENEMLLKLYQSKMVSPKTEK